MFRQSLSLVTIICFFLTSLGPLPKAHADSVLGLPAPGTMVNLSPAYEPVIIKGLTVHKDNPFLFDFIVDVGQDKMSGEPLKKEGEKLIKYFLASLAIPDKDAWVNLSPYEKNRIIPEALGQTDMGRDLLEQDYILKQITASLIYPEKKLGKMFWDKVYTKAQAMYGTTQVPVNTFNKVWIMADRAEVFEHNQTAFVVGCHLKVMLEEDYLALVKHQTRYNPTHSIASEIVKQIILPELEKEVNTGKNFANLRQIFNSVILASWYKKSLKEALLNQVYADRSRVKGIHLNDPTVKDHIYEQYLKAYKKGVFNYIKDDVNAGGTMIPRKYFSGGLQARVPLKVIDDLAMGAAQMNAAGFGQRPLVDFATVATTNRGKQPSFNNASFLSDIFDIVLDDWFTQILDHRTISDEEKADMKEILKGFHTDVGKFGEWHKAFQTIRPYSGKFKNVEEVYHFWGQVPGMGIFLVRKALGIDALYAGIPDDQHRVKFIFEKMEQFFEEWGRYDGMFLNVDLIPVHSGPHRTDITFVHNGEIAADQLTKMLSGEDAAMATALSEIRNEWLGSTEKVISEEQKNRLRVILATLKDENDTARFELWMAWLKSLEPGYKSFENSQQLIDFIQQLPGMGNEMAGLLNQISVKITAGKKWEYVDREGKGAKEGEVVQENQHARVKFLFGQLIRLSTFWLETDNWRQYSISVGAVEVIGRNLHIQPVLTSEPKNRYQFELSMKLRGHDPAMLSDVIRRLNPSKKITENQKDEMRRALERFPRNIAKFKQWLKGFEVLKTKANQFSSPLELIDYLRQWPGMGGELATMAELIYRNDFEEKTDKERIDYIFSKLEEFLIKWGEGGEESLTKQYYVKVSMPFNSLLGSPLNSPPKFVMGFEPSGLLFSKDRLTKMLSGIDAAMTAKEFSSMSLDEQERELARMSRNQLYVLQARLKLRILVKLNNDELLPLIEALNQVTQTLSAGPVMATHVVENGGRTLIIPDFDSSPSKVLRVHVVLRQGQEIPHTLKTGMGVDVLVRYRSPELYEVAIPTQDRISLKWLPVPSKDVLSLLINSEGLIVNLKFGLRKEYLWNPLMIQVYNNSPNNKDVLVSYQSDFSTGIASRETKVPGKVVSHVMLKIDVSSAMTAKVVQGGIDLNTSNGVQWKINKQGNGVEMDIDPAVIARIRREGIDSLSEIILSMTPITDIWSLAGIQVSGK